MRNIRHIILCLIVILCFTRINAQDVPASQRQALIDLYNATNGPNWNRNNNWNTSDPVRTWQGVVVVDNQVTSLNLRANRLTGTIPSFLNQLSSLETLNLSLNFLSGSIPKEIGEFVSLETLDLSGCLLTGNIPSELGNLTNLTSLNLENNQLTGSIPTGFGSLVNLTSLRLRNNQLSGSIPTQLGNLINLTSLRFDGNNLTGTLPSTLGNLVALTDLRFIGNQLTGNIPPEYGNLTNLLNLYFTSNQLTGSIPSSFGNLVNLQGLGVSNNRLNGTIPIVIANLPNLISWHFHNNRFHFEDFENEHTTYIDLLNSYGYAPQAKVDQEETLSVAENGNITLTSTALTSLNNSYQWYKDGVAIAGATNKDLVISNATSGDAGVYYFEATNSVVTGLTLTRNDITLEVTADACGVSATEKQALLDLYNATNGDSWTNTLAGNQPWDTNTPVCDWYGVTVVNGNVTQISLSGNDLDGVLPAQLNQLTNLIGLYLSRNHITGDIPLGLSQLNNLQHLSFFDNDISGSIPSDFGQLVSLRTLNLEQNQLTGNIPDELGQISNLTQLQLRSNLLSGEIPSSLGQLSNLRLLYLSNNQLTGDIPIEIGQLDNLGNLWLSSNQLSGTIPAELSQLTNLQRLTLDNNLLTGSIPRELVQLSNLINLYLNNNQLDGSIPSELGNLQNLERLYLHNNQLEGLIPDFSILPLSFLQFRNNKFVFGDFENQHIAYESNINTYTFSPQAEINEEETHFVCVEESLVLTTTTTGTQNHYQWFKNGTPIAGALDAPTYLIQSATMADAGIYHCEVTSDIVTGLTLLRKPIEVTISSLVEDTHNTITNRGYDIDGSQKVAGKSFFDGLGQLEQTQTWNILTNETWASQVMRDAFHRSALQTLSAPITSGSQFNYQEGFVTKTDQTEYTLADYQDPSNPALVGNGVNTLGWYYSTNNTDNPYQDITGYPFARTIFSKLNPGKSLAAIGGNKVDTNRNGTIDANDTWPQSYTFTMPATDELSLAVAFGDINYKNIQTIKTVVRDVHGVENVVFADTDGKILGAARSGEGAISGNMNLFIGEQGFVDVHIPKGITGISTSNDAAIRVYDLISEELVSSSLATLSNGFYRVAVNNIETYEPNTIFVRYRVNYYDYSLNEYDEADRLVKSYQPLGETKATKLFTEYRYNTLDQLVYTISPDEGEAWFKYREDGQIRFSQNSKQKAAGEFSYTHYDTYGRPVESGVFLENATYSFNPTTNNALDAILNNTYTLDDIWNDVDDFPNTDCKEQQFTTYDIADDAAMAIALATRSVDYPSQSFVAGNVAHTANAYGETWYSYDIYGRVKWLVQQIQGLGTKTIDYEYDPITGLVTKVLYQKGVSGEQFIHRYTYNIADQLTKVETSTNNSVFTTQAEYEYYETGALKRTELANGAQGLDYVYNLAGQLKSINHPSLDPLNDPGGDTNDLFGMALDYHNGDYVRTNAPTPVGTFLGRTDQFNGNIKSTRWNNSYLPIAGGEYRYHYDYDRNNWLTGANFQASGTATGSAEPSLVSTTVITDGENTELKASNNITLLPGFHAQSGSDVRAFITLDETNIDYGEGDYDVSNITYDANGNIKTLRRNKDGDTVMDDLQYTYTNGTNQLSHVDDSAGDVSGADDLSDQEVNNYIYNSIGQLVRNESENIDYFYNASGLVTQVDQNGQAVVKFFYNDRNHRVKKESYANGILANTSFYVRDVAGQVMAIYNDGNGAMALAEQPIYGSGRVGVSYISSSVGDNRSYVYELTDHLGNVRAVFTKEGAENNIGEGFTDYYPGGMAMPGRQITGAEQYRYGYQGQFAETDPETGKPAFEARLYDPRIMRWLTIDPAGEFFSPYLAMGNNFPNVVDPDGRCTKCPKDAKVGDTYDHPEYGTLTYTDNGWGSDSAGFVLDDVYVFGSRSAMEAGVGVVSRSNTMSWTDFEMAWRLEIGRLKNRQQAINMALFAGLSAEVFGIASFSPQQQIVSSPNRFVGPMTRVQSTVAAAETATPLLAPVKTVKHHIFNVFRGGSPKSQVYRDFFKKHRIDINAHTIEISEATHKIVHGKGNNWTTKWKNFIDTNPNATTKEVYQQAGRMLDEYGLSHVPIVRY